MAGFFFGAGINPSRCAFLRASRLLAHSLFRRLFEGAPCLHFAEEAFPLHLLFQNAKGLIDIVVPYENLQDISFR
jgi:hypothetical protein